VTAQTRADRWPALPLADWQETYTTLRLWAQIVAKVMGRLATPEDEWWHVALQPRTRGLASSLLPYERGSLEIAFDFVDHNLRLLTSEGDLKALPLMPRSVASFYAELLAALRALGVEVSIETAPEEGVSAVPFDRDEEHASYDRAAVERWWSVTMNVLLLLKQHQSLFRGRASPIHYFAESFDLNYVRYSGRRVPSADGGESSAEQIAAGFWPGGGAIDGAAFYAYASPEPSGIAGAAIRPSAATYDARVGEFILRYDDVRTSDSPETAIRDFLQSTYEAGATLAGWDRNALEVRAPGQ
jgi:hypothetical protein